MMPYMGKEQFIKKGYYIMSTRSERTKAIETLEKEFKDAKGIYLTDINRIDVERITRLRNVIRKKGMKYIVVKNTLAKIALEHCGKKELMPYFKGQIGVVVAQKESMAPARIIRDFQKDNKAMLEVRVAYVDGSMFSGRDTSRLADIPGREELLSQLLGTLQAPMANLAGALSAVMGKFVGALDALKRKRESEPVAS